MKQQRKCFNCREPLKSKTKIFCKKCQGKPVKTSATLVIYDKI